MARNEVFSNASEFSQQELQIYGRQMVLPQVGLLGQKLLKNSSVAIVGAGGLGCPASLYLAGAGIGTLRIIDKDIVTLTNLQRQISHTVAKENQNKAESAKEECLARNPSVEVQAVQEFITPKNAIHLLKDIDVIVDASDNIQTRYLLNDVSIYLKIPLVSGAALRWGAQLSVFNLTREAIEKLHIKHKDIFLNSKEEDKDYLDICNSDWSCLCYRCFTPVIPTSSGSCETQGVIGPAPGVIGIMQAAETMKVCLHLFKSVLCNKMLIYNVLNPLRLMRVAILRPPNKDCVSCGSKKNLTYLLTGTNPYEAFKCNTSSNYSGQSMSPDKFYSDFLSIEKKENGIKELKVKPDSKAVVLDVRPQEQYSIVNIHGSVSYPAAELYRDISKAYSNNDLESVISKVLPESQKDIIVFCRRGVESKRAATALTKLFDDANSQCNIINAEGGLFGLCEKVPCLSQFPAL